MASPSIRNNCEANELEDDDHKCPICYCDLFPAFTFRCRHKVCEADWESWRSTTACAQSVAVRDPQCTIIRRRSLSIALVFAASGRVSCASAATLRIQRCTRASRRFSAQFVGIASWRPPQTSTKRCSALSTPRNFESSRLQRRRCRATRRRRSSTNPNSTTQSRTQS